MIIGITGQSGVGKTTVSMVFKKYGFVILDVDRVARDTIDKNPKYKKDIAKSFGNEVLSESGVINRKILAEKVFKSRETLYKLNRIVNPYVFDEMHKRIDKIKDRKDIIIDAATLFESKVSNLCDYVITVIAPKNVMINRIINRDKISFDMALKRVNAQFKQEFYVAKSDYILTGYKDMTTIDRQIKSILAGIEVRNKKYEKEY